MQSFLPQPTFLLQGLDRFGPRTPLQRSWRGPVQTLARRVVASRASSSPPMRVSAVRKPLVCSTEAVRSPNAPELAHRAEQRPERLILAPQSHGLAARQSGALLTYAALTLGVTGTVPVRPELPSRLDAQRQDHAGDARLWAAAHDLFGDDQFLACARSAKLPGMPMRRAFALFRRHQPTDETR